MVIRKVERQLLNECVRTINNSIDSSSLQRDTSIDQLATDLERLPSGSARPSLTGSGKPDTKASWNAKRLCFQGCGTNIQPHYGIVLFWTTSLVH